MEIAEILTQQKAYFLTGETLREEFRLSQLRKLREAVLKNEEALYLALKKDLNKSRFESYEAEIGLVLEEISFFEKHLHKLMKPRRVKTPIMHFPSHSAIYHDPYGSVLIMAPWNYPFQLALVPLVGAIATGNCAFVKPSNYSANTSALICKMIGETFPSSYIAAVEGGREVNQTLLDNPFDYIFFTGGVTVGKLVMQKAAQFVTPVTLELGGKSPCIVEKTADIPLAAKRILWGKLLNAGQTCVAPDFVLAQKEIRPQLIEEMKRAIVTLYGASPIENDNYPKIINRKHFDRLCALLASGNILYGGQTCPENQTINPTLLDADWDSEIMKDEIFGPLLPILSFSTIDEVITHLGKRPKPLALYLFTKDREIKKRVISRCTYGGGCINDVVVHLATSHMPFGGVGQSGMGNYHGARSFDTLSHEKSVLEKACWLDLPVRYTPASKRDEQLVRKLLK